MVFGSVVLRVTLRISRERCSSADIIFRAWPGILGETVLTITFGPENFTSTSATLDLEFATSWSLSMIDDVEQLEEDGEGSSSNEADDDAMVVVGDGKKLLADE